MYTFVPLKGKRKESKLPNGRAVKRDQRQRIHRGGRAAACHSMRWRKSPLRFKKPGETLTPKTPTTIKLVIIMTKRLHPRRKTQSMIKLLCHRLLSNRLKAELTELHLLAVITAATVILHALAAEQSTAAPAMVPAIEKSKVRVTLIAHPAATVGHPKFPRNSSQIASNPSCNLLY